MNNIVNIALNVIRRLSKEKSMLLYLIVFPILASVLVVAITGNTKQQNVGVVHSDFSGGFIEYMRTIPQYNIKLIDEASIEAQLLEKSLNMVIVYKGASAGFKGGQLDKPFILYSNDNNEGLLELEGILTAFLSNSNPASKAPDADNNFEISSGRMALGFLTMMMLMFISNTVGMILEDSKDKTLMRTFSGPIKGIHYATGHLITNFIIGSVQIAMFIFVTKYIVKVDWKIPFLQVFSIMMVFLITVIGLCVGLTGITKNQQQLSVMNTMITVFTCLLGGSFFPSTLMPNFFQRLALLTPQRWIMEAYDKLASGGGLQDIQMNLLILMLFAFVFFSFGVKTLRPTEGEL